MTFVTHPERMIRSQDTKTIMVIIEPETSAIKSLSSVVQNLHMKGKYTQETLRLAWHIVLEILLYEMMGQVQRSLIESTENAIKTIKSLESYYKERGHVIGQTWTIDKRGVLVDGPNDDFIELCLVLLYSYSGTSKITKVFTDIANHYSDSTLSLSTTSIDFLENGRYLVYITVNVNANDPNT